MNDIITLNKESLYSQPIFDKDFGYFIARLDFKTHNDNKYFCYFTLENGRKIVLSRNIKRTGEFLAINSQYDFRAQNNEGALFQIIISKNRFNNPQLESPQVLNYPQKQLKLTLDKITKKEVSYKLPTGIKYYNEINNSKFLEEEFFKACQNGNISLVKYFIEKRKININASDFNGGSSGLRLASSNGHLHIVKYLLTSNRLSEHADFNSKDNFSKYPAFRMACNHAHIKIIKYFYLKKYFINDYVLKKVTINAFQNNSYEVLNILLNKYHVNCFEVIQDFLKKSEPN